MGLFRALIFAGLLCLTLGANDSVEPGPILTSSTTAPSSSSTSSSTTSSTTVKPTTPPPPPTHPTTPKPTTKSTTAATTTTTTPKPTPPPTTPSTTTPKPPAPTPAPTHVGRWLLNYTDTDKPCLIFEGAIDIDLTYQDGKVNKTVQVQVNSSATATGECNSANATVKSDETLKLAWGISNTITFNFQKNDSKKYMINAIIVTLAVQVPDEKEPKLFVLAHNEDEFATPIANSYKCAKEQDLRLTSQMRKDIYSGKLRLSSLQLQAFRDQKSNSTKFDEALDCATYETPDVVPIAVGCALAALVIIVLIAYLIGRRRSQARGYLSM